MSLELSEDETRALSALLPLVDLQQYGAHGSVLTNLYKKIVSRAQSLNDGERTQLPSLSQAAGRENALLTLARPQPIRPSAPACLPPSILPPLSLPSPLPLSPLFLPPLSPTFSQSLSSPLTPTFSPLSPTFSPLSPTFSPSFSPPFSPTTTVVNSREASPLKRPADPLAAGVSLSPSHTPLFNTSTTMHDNFTGDTMHHELNEDPAPIAQLTDTADHSGVHTADSSSGNGNKRTATQAGLDPGPLRRSLRLAVPVPAAGADIGAPAGSVGSGSEDARAKAAKTKTKRKKKCPSRGGDSKRITRPVPSHLASNVEGMLSQLEEEGEPPSNERLSRSNLPKGIKKKNTVWTIDGEPPAAQREAALTICDLALVSMSLDRQETLQAFLNSLNSDASPLEPACTSLAATLINCAKEVTNSVVQQFKLMKSFIEASFYIQWRKSQDPKLGYRELAKEVGHPSVTQKKIEVWYGYGSRLIYLAAASSTFIVPLLAVAGCSSRVYNKESITVVEQIGYLLNNPHAPDHKHRLSADCGQLTRSVVIPQMVALSLIGGRIAEQFALTFPPNANGVSESIKFSDFKKMSEKLRSFDTSYWKLPKRDPCWSVMVNPLISNSIPHSNMLSLTEECVAEEITIRTNLSLQDTVCPVTPETTEAWTDRERVKAAEALVVQDLEDLELKVNELHASGEPPGRYICIPTEICEGKVLTIRGTDDRLLATVITNLADQAPKQLQTMGLHLLSAVMEGEVFPVDTGKGRVQFCATHKTFWNRHGEQGHGAPSEAHPNYIRKMNATRVNHTQRSPYPSKEMTEDPDETAILSEFIQVVTSFIEHHLIKLLPQEYATIKVYAERLPLHERGPAHPFGGFVLNIRVSTEGHRDPGDKLFCCVMPLGEWAGGELAFFEPGLLFRLRPWDIIIFHSCDITHFNMPFQGTRLSFVFHTDKHGDNWVNDLNGWEPRNSDGYKD